MILVRPRLSTYIGLMIGTAYILSIGLVYPLLEEASGAESPTATSPVKECRISQNVTVPLMTQMQTNLENAKQAEKSGNHTHAIEQIRETQSYLSILDDLYFRLKCD